MAKKLDPRTTRNHDGSEDLAILHPDRQVVIADRDLVVREYRFAESLRLRHLTGPIVDGLYAAFKLQDQLNVDQVIDMLAEQADVVTQLIAASTSTTPEWVESLSANEGERLAIEWWIVNRDFFVTRAMRRIALDKATASAGPTSTTHSPDGTEISNGSGNTPTAS